MSAFDSLFSNDVFLEAFSSTVGYARGELEADVVAMDSLISAQQQLDYGASVVFEAKEWQIEVALLNDFTEPERGDIVTDGNGKEWQVSNVGGAPMWEYDADENYFRIRTVKIGD